MMIIHEYAKACPTDLFVRVSLMISARWHLNCVAALMSHIQYGVVLVKCNIMGLFSEWLSKQQVLMRDTLNVVFLERLCVLSGLILCSPQVNDIPSVIDRHLPESHVKPLLTRKLQIPFVFLFNQS